MAYDDTGFSYDDYNSYMEPDLISSYMDPGFDSLLSYQEPNALTNFDLGQGFNYSPQGIDQLYGLDLNSLMSPEVSQVIPQFGAGFDPNASASDMSRLMGLYGNDPYTARALSDLQLSNQADDASTMLTGQLLAGQGPDQSLIQDLEAAGVDWRSLMAPSYGRSNAAWAENPLSSGLLGQVLRPAQSYLDAEGNVVGDISSGADIQNPYDYMQGPDGSTYIHNLNTGRDIGYLDANNRNQTYQDVRMANQTGPSMWETVKSALGIGANATGSAAQRTGTSAARTSQASQSSNPVTSGLAQAAALANALGMIVKAGTGNNAGPNIQARDSTVADTGPRIQRAKALRTVYAKGGAIESPRGGLFEVTAKLGDMLRSHYGLIDGDAGGQDDVVDIRAAPGEYVFDAESVSALGDGNTAAGAKKLDEMRYAIREHKRTGGLNSIPPKAKHASRYLKGK